MLAYVHLNAAQFFTSCLDDTKTEEMTENTDEIEMRGIEASTAGVHQM